MPVLAQRTLAPTRPHQHPAAAGVAGHDDVEGSDIADDETALELETEVTLGAFEQSGSRLPTVAAVFRGVWAVINGGEGGTMRLQLLAQAAGEGLEVIGGELPAGDAALIGDDDGEQSCRVEQPDGVDGTGVERESVYAVRPLIPQRSMEVQEDRRGAAHQLSRS
jgi:hypothetical protein